MNLALRIYRRLAQAFPHEFKLAYGPEVMQLGEDVVEEIAKQARNSRPDPIDRRHRHSRPDGIPERNARRHAIRDGERCIKSPGFALVGIISMGLGIGLTTNVYSSKWTLLFREMPAAANAEAFGDVSSEKPVVVLLHRAISPAEKPFRRSGRDSRPACHSMSRFKGDFNAKPERVFGQIVSARLFFRARRAISARTRARTPNG